MSELVELNLAAKKPEPEVVLTYEIGQVFSYGKRKAFLVHQWDTPNAYLVMCPDDMSPGMMWSAKPLPVSTVSFKYMVKQEDFHNIESKTWIPV